MVTFSCESIQLLFIVTYTIIKIQDWTLKFIRSLVFRYLNNDITYCTYIYWTKRPIDLQIFKLIRLVIVLPQYVEKFVPFCVFVFWPLVLRISCSRRWSVVMIEWKFSIQLTRKEPIFCVLPESPSSCLTLTFS